MHQNGSTSSLKENKFNPISLSSPIYPKQPDFFIAHLGWHHTTRKKTQQICATKPEARYPVVLQVLLQYLKGQKPMDDLGKLELLAPFLLRRKWIYVTYVTSPKVIFWRGLIKSTIFIQEFSSDSWKGWVKSWEFLLYIFCIWLALGFFHLIPLYSPEN